MDWGNAVVSLNWALPDEDLVHPDPEVAGTAGTSGKVLNQVLEETLGRRGREVWAGD